MEIYHLSEYGTEATIVGRTRSARLLVQPVREKQRDVQQNEYDGGGEGERGGGNIEGSCNCRWVFDCDEMYVE